MKIRFLLLSSLLIVFSVFAQDVDQNNDRPKIGLVLSGGGAKGFAHIGVLKMLDSLKIPVDYIAGTSMGGIAGAFYAIGYSGNELELLVKRSDWEEIFTDKPRRKILPYFEKKEKGKYQLEFGLKGFKPVPPKGLIFGQKISLLFSSFTFPYEQITSFDDFPIPFRCVAVDLVTGNQVVLNNGSLAKAMRATMAIPTVFSPVEWGDSLLVDGGMVNNLPVDVVKEMGADIVIAVDVEDPLKRKEELDSVLEIFQQSTLIMGIERKRKNLKFVDILIQPDISGFSVSDFDNEKISTIITRGENAAKKNQQKFIALKNNLGTFSKFDTTLSKSLIKSNKKITIYGISIEGQTILPFGFIYRLLGFKPGDQLDTDILNARIMELYGLGYFESIQYHIQPAIEGQVNLTINVKELPIRRLRVGLRYDEHHKLVAVVSGQATNLLIPGLRVENEIQFAGLKKFKLKAFYPSRALNLPLYPIIQFNYKDISTNIFDDLGNRIARYKDRSSTLGAGLGFLFSNYFNGEIQIQEENMEIKPSIAAPDPTSFPQWKDRLRRIHAVLNYDTFDDVLLPREGLFIQAKYEKGLPKLKTDLDYYLASVSFDFYRTFYERHTTRLYGFWGTGSKNLPLYKFHNQGKPNFFVGMKYDQLFGSKMSLLRLDYRYQYKKDIFFKLAANVAFDLEYNLPGQTFRYNNLLGYGLGVTLLSPVGPIEILISRGDKCFTKPREQRYVSYFTLGYKF